MKIIRTIKKLLPAPKNKYQVLVHSLAFLSLILGMTLTPDALGQDLLGISIKKIMTIIFAVGIIQVLGIICSRTLNSHAGVVIHGFISGLISSTALTVTLAKKSHKMTAPQREVESLSFLSATLAMLLQGLFLSIVTVPSLPLKMWALFLIPIFTTLALMVRRSLHTQHISIKKEKVSLSWMPILKLALFICVILSASNHAKNLLGDLGLQVVTFIISLFEIHGAIVSSTQMFANKTISLHFFSNLILLSIIASYVSKLGIIYTLAHSYIKKKITIWTGVIFLSILAYYFIFPA